jgi:hypothetical protein
MLNSFSRYVHNAFANKLARGTGFRFRKQINLLSKRANLYSITHLNLMPSIRTARIQSFDLARCFTILLIAREVREVDTSLSSHRTMEKVFNQRSKPSPFKSLADLGGD